MKKNHYKLIEILFIFFISLTPFIWLKPSQLILGHDSGFRLDPINHLYNIFYSWSSLTNFGVDWSFFKGFLITQFPEALFTYITRSLWWGQELSFIFWFFSMAISMYILLNNLFPKKEYWFLRIISSIFYVYNFFILQGWFIAERAKFSLYAALPLGFLVLYNTLQKKYSLLKGTVLFSFIFFIFNGGGNPPLYGGLLVTYAVLVIYFLIIKAKTDKLKGIFYVTKIVGICLAATVIINAYWVFPQAYLTIHSYTAKLSSTGGVEGLLAWERVISKNASLNNLFRLEGIPDWYDNPVHPYSNLFLTNPFLIVGSFIPFLTILIGMACFKKIRASFQETHLLFVLLIALVVGIIFSAGTHPPLGIIYEWFMRYIPGFAIFRSSYYKFSPSVFFSVSILSGVFMNEILQMFIKKKVLSFGVKLIIIIFAIVYHFPYFTTNFFMFNNPYTTKVTIPQYVINAFGYLNSRQNETDKVLLLPQLNPSLQADGYRWGYWSLDLLLRVGLKTPVVASDSDTSLVEGIYKAIDNDDENLFLQLTAIAGINKILWRDDVLYNDHKTTSNNFKKEEDTLQSFSHIALDKSFGAWRIYNITNANPSIFSPIYHVNTISTGDFQMADLIQLSPNETSEAWIDVSQNKDKRIIQKNLSVQQDQCASCSEDAIEIMAQNLKMPSVRFLPWSKIYFLIIFKEKKELSSTVSNPIARLDVDLSHADKRLVEIWRMSYQDFNSKTPLYVKNNVDKYIATMQDASTQIHNIDPKMKRDYLIRLAAYLQFQKIYISPFVQNLLIKNDIEKLISYIDSQQISLNQQMWISTSNTDKKTYVTLAGGQYSIVQEDDSNSAPQLFIDGNSLDNMDNVNLPKGEHSLEVKYLNIENHIGSNVQNLEDAVKEVNPYKSLQIPIKNFSNKKSYIISFMYQTSSHAKAQFSISEENNPSSKSESVMSSGLITDGKQHMFSYTYTPTSGIYASSINFSSLNAATILLSQIQIEEKNNPRIYFISKEAQATKNNVALQYKQIDPTTYVVMVKNSTQPFVLLFNQTFSPGWIASYIPLQSDLRNKKERISENNHLVLNGYSNGWNIDKKGNFTVLIEYYPQEIFYTGIIVSVIGIVIASIIGLYAVKKKV